MPVKFKATAYFKDGTTYEAEAAEADLGLLIANWYQYGVCKVSGCSSISRKLPYNISVEAPPKRLLGTTVVQAPSQEETPVPEHIRLWREKV